MVNTVLFLCSGNYYRSRFAEHWFNHLAKQRGLAWIADSAGLLAQCASHNVGALSPHTHAALTQRGVALDAVLRSPVDVTEEHFARAQRVVALYRAEHEPMLQRAFARHAARVAYWDCPDVPLVAPAQCLPAIERAVLALVSELERPGS